MSHEEINLNDVEKNVWIKWHYTPENPYPKFADGEDPLVIVEFGDLSVSSMERGMGARPISYWHDDGGDCNNFEQADDLPDEVQIIAYMLVDEHDHD